MNNFFLLNEAVDLNDFDEFKYGMSELVAIDKHKDDVFRKHESLYKIDCYAQLFLNYGQTEQTITQFIEQTTSHEHYIPNEKIFTNYFPDTENGFLGIEFSKTDIHFSCQINNEDAYNKFKNDNLWDLSFRNLWSKREYLFPNLILCGEVENQIKKIGNSGHFNQIVERLIEFNKAVKSWETGDFSYKRINQQFSLRISPESDKTMDSYQNERIFSMPNGGTNIFELHIKTGDLRFHFYPDNLNHKVYVGYIGPHLSTISN